MAQQQMLVGAPTTSITLNFNNQSVIQSGVLANQTAGYRINTSGIAEALNRTTYSTLETWLTTGAAGDYEVYCTTTGDALTTGTTGSWLALSSSREWTLNATVIGVPLFTELTILVRVIATGVVIDSFVVQLDSEKT